ncbi:MAG TPA: sigma 54-interacting transcriptional regulator [Byssovorax sp.]
MGAAGSGDGTEKADRASLDAVHRALRGRAALLLHHGGGVEVVVLEPGNAIVVGRGAPSNVQIADKALSKAHARFSLVGTAVRVEDLGSTNGTWVGGARVATIDVSVGAEVKLGSVVARAHLLEQSNDEAARASGRSSFGEVVVGARTADVFERAERIADSRLAVLVLGETGTGKEVLARFIHERSRGASKPFVAVNCGAIPGQLVESTLFGHERGAFTGAVQQHKGVFEAAHEGTVLLDEIGELPREAQAALLLVLESGRFTRVGSTREVPVDVRVIAATHKDLEAMIAAGTFRADLYYRLQGAVLRLPPLRERADEIRPLVDRLVARANAQHGRGVTGMTDDALAALEGYAWPGNVRELRNAVDQAVVVARGAVVTREDLPAYVRSAEPRLVGREPTPVASRSDEDGEPAGELREQVDRYEASLIERALEATGGHRGEAAKRLGLPLRTLARRIKLLGIKEPR